MSREQIAIIGLSCRFPGAQDPDALWELLARGGDAIRELPRDRWDVDRYYDPELSSSEGINTRWAGTLDGIDLFEPGFFGLSAREAAGMDPQQRLVLEVAWEALERAGQNPQRLAGSRTGVFVGVSTADYQLMHRRAPTRGGTGIAPSIVANRLSHALDLRGPSMAIDTACSSSLVAIDLACQSLLLGASDFAIAGGVNAILTPTWHVSFSQAGMLSSQGRCKTFDASADGYVRSEGCGLVVLRRLSDALASNAPILAVIRGSATNQDGHTASLTAPNGAAQQAVMREALARAGVAPSQIGLIEAHGTGTALGDETEVAALNGVLSEGRAPGEKCLIGSVKTNIGHLEAGAGVAGLIKAVLALRNELVPPHLHLKQVNPKLRLDETCLEITQTPRPWPRGARPRLVGVNSFGFGGTNAHAVLEEAPVRPERTARAERPVHLVALSARTETAVGALAGRLAGALAGATDVADACHTLNTGRAQLPVRAAVCAPSREALAAGLKALSEGRAEEGVYRAQGQPKRPRVAFLFTGQGSQWPGMGRELYETQPIFRAALHRFDEILKPHLEWSVLSMIEPDYPAEALASTVHAQPAIVALELALAETWRSWGIEPAAVLGHSLGEFVAACVAGVMDVEEMLPLIARRARLMGALPGDGAMALVTAPAEQVSEVLAGQGGVVAVAAFNGPKHTVISGPRPAVERALQAFEEQYVFTQLLRVSHAFHSAQMEPMLDEFEQAAARVRYQAARVPLVSNLTGQPGAVIDAGYWRRQIREPVRFMDGVVHLAELGCEVLLELGPANSLAELAKKTLAGRDTTLLWSLQRDRPAWKTMLHSLATLYVRGADVDWEALDAGCERRKLALPTYPFERRRCWLGPDEMRQPE
jgi:acyl transferase domain-containing protein